MFENLGLLIWLKKNIVMAMLASGTFSSLITWWSNGCEYGFIRFAVPNALINGLFGTALALTLKWIYPTIPFELVIIIAATAGSIGKHALVFTISKFLKLDKEG